MSKITPDHLARHAYVYVRQSSPEQLLHNHESRRLSNDIPNCPPGDTRNCPPVAPLRRWSVEA
ncbi:hypothetical protein RY843_33230, partial [Azospirillum brasilense]|nr:hypothetical protein [Azospirillum brasilense]